MRHVEDKSRHQGHLTNEENKKAARVVTTVTTPRNARIVAMETVHK